jgi:glucosamine--fructose-6-phosphate aminotransferase (isomerizing)
MSRIVKPVEELDWDLEAAERGGHSHFMLKEIHEQPTSLEATMRGRIQRSPAAVKLGGLSDVAGILSEARRIIFTACGTSWHAGLIGKFMVEEFARVQADVEYASEWRYRNPVLEPGTVVVGISQSGETADTLAALSLAQEKIPWQRYRWPRRRARPHWASSTWWEAPSPG